MELTRRFKFMKMIKTDEPDTTLKVDELVLSSLKDKEFAENLENLWKLYNEE